MKPVWFNGSTTIGAPKDWDGAKRGPCGNLPVKVDDAGRILSRWRPSWRELLALVFGGRVELRVVSWGMPPVSLGVIRDKASD